MPCKADCRQGILNKVFSELVEGDYTFSRQSESTIKVNNQQDNKLSRAENQRVARRLANEMVTRVATSFNGHVTGYINEYSLYDPITISFVVSNQYIDHVFNEYNDKVDETGRIASSDDEGTIKKTDIHGVANHVSIINTLSGLEGATRLKQDSPHENINTYLKDHKITSISAKQLMDRMISTKSIPISLSQTIDPKVLSTEVAKSYANNSDYEYEEYSVTVPLDETGATELGKVQAFRNKNDNSLVVLNINGSGNLTSGNNILRNLDNRFNRFVIQGLVQKARREGVPDILISPTASVFAPADFAATRVVDQYGHNWNKIEANREHGNEILVVPGDDSDRRKERANASYENSGRLQRLGSRQEYMDFIDSLPGDIIYELGGREDQGAFDEHLFEEGIGRYEDMAIDDPGELHYNTLEELEEAERTSFKTDEENGDVSTSFSVSTVPDNRQIQHIQTLRGPNTYDEGFSMMVVTAQAGTYENYLKAKRAMLAGYKNRINRLQDKMKQLTDIVKKDPRLGAQVTDRLTEYKNEIRKLKNEAYGNKYTGKTGLKQEIEDLENDQNRAIRALAPYLDRDIERLNALIRSNDSHDFKEARSLIDFIQRCANFSVDIVGKAPHPFFPSDDDIFEKVNGKFTSDVKIDPAIVKMFKDWAQKTERPEAEIDRREKELLVSQTKDDPLFKSTYTDKATGITREFGYNELTYKDTGLGDTDYLSMYTMDVTLGIFSHNGLIPQVMFSSLANDMEEHLAWSRGVAARMDAMHSKIIKALKKLDDGAHTLRRIGIIGPQGVSYNLFKQKTKHGHENGKLISRYTDNYEEAQYIKLATLKLSVNIANQIPDPGLKQQQLNSAFNDYKKWLRSNTVMLDITRIPEIANASEFATFGARADTAYERELKALLGDRGYKEEVDKQMASLREYQADKRSLLNTLLIAQGGGSTTLDANHQRILDEWEARENPVKGAESYYKVDGGKTIVDGRVQHATMRYNNTIPRKQIANVTENVNGTYDFVDSGTDSKYYNEDFKKIEDDPDLRDFYDLLKEVCEKIYQNTPTEISKGIAADSLPALNRTAREMYLSKENGWLKALFLSFRKMWDNVKGKLGTIEEGDIAPSRIDPLSGQPGYGINNTFMKNNGRRIENKTKLEQEKFRIKWNNYRTTNRLRGNYLDKLTRNTVIKLSNADRASLEAIAEFANIEISSDELDRGDVSKIRAVLGDEIKIGRLIQEYSTHAVVQTQSFDLPKLIKYFSNATMVYAARENMLPTMEIMRKHYMKIQRPAKNSVDNPQLTNQGTKFVTVGPRDRANRQMNSWFKRAVLGDYSGSTSTAVGFKGQRQTDDTLKRAKIFGEKLYSTEEKREIREINELIQLERNPHRIVELKGMQERLGKTRTVGAMMDNLFSWIRFVKMGYNLSSSVTNFMEGVSCNMALASTGKYFDEKEIFYGYGLLKYSFMRPFARLVGFESRRARKMRMLMDRFNVLVDSRNEMQKSSNETIADKFSFLNPFDLNHRVEYFNQSPIMVAMLRTLKLKDAMGNDTRVSVWDGFDSHGNLLPQYDNEHNRGDWSELSGSGYRVFKQNLNNAIGLAHGYGYDEMRGMMIKEGSMGKALSMFKTWLPSAIFARLGRRQDNILASEEGFKGRYRAYSKTGGFFHGAIVGIGMFGGPWGILAGFGGIAAAMINSDKSFYNGIGWLKQSVEIVQQMLLRCIGTPVNIAAALVLPTELTKGKKLIPMDRGFEKWVGKGGFTAQDAQNMRSNMSDIAGQLFILLMICVVKGMLYDDDDEPDSTERKAHNILINKLMQLSSSAAMYVNPPDLINNVVGNIGPIQFYTDLKDWLTSIEKAWDGTDIDDTGKSRVWSKTSKLFMPGIFADPLTLGFEKSSERVFVESPLHHYFQSYWKKDQIWAEGHRAARRNQLMEFYKRQLPNEELRTKYVNRIVDKEIPGTTYLRKHNITRERYNEMTKGMHLAPK